MTFNINLTGGTLPQLPANTYTGTLNIQAQATRSLQEIAFGEGGNREMRAPAL